MNELFEISMMKNQLEDMKHNPRKYESAFASGYVFAGFGGDLNGINIPETFMSGKLPSSISPQQALKTIIEFMEKTIKDAELQQQNRNILEKNNLQIK